MFGEVRSLDDARRLAMEMLKSPQAKGARDAQEVMHRMGLGTPRAQQQHRHHHPNPHHTPAAHQARSYQLPHSSEQPPSALPTSYGVFPRKPAAPQDALSMFSSSGTAVPQLAPTPPPAPAPTPAIPSVRMLPTSPLFRQADFQKCLSYVLDPQPRATLAGPPSPQAPPRRMSPPRPTEAALREATQRRVEEMHRMAEERQRTLEAVPAQPAERASAPVSQAAGDGGGVRASPVPPDVPSLHVSEALHSESTVPKEQAALQVSRDLQLQDVEPEEVEVLPRERLQRDSEMDAMRREIDWLRSELDTTKLRVSQVERELVEVRTTAADASAVANAARLKADPTAARVADIEREMAQIREATAAAAEAAAAAVAVQPQHPRGGGLPLISSPSPPEVPQPHYAHDSPRANILSGVCRSPRQLPSTRVSPLLPEVPQPAQPPSSSSVSIPMESAAPESAELVAHTSKPTSRISESNELKQLQELLKRRDELEQSMSNNAHLYGGGEGHSAHPGHPGHAAPHPSHLAHHTQADEDLSRDVARLASNIHESARRMNGVSQERDRRSSAPPSDAHPGAAPAPGGRSTQHVSPFRIAGGWNAPGSTQTFRSGFPPAYASGRRGTAPPVSRADSSIATMVP